MNKNKVIFVGVNISVNMTSLTNPTFKVMFVGVHISVNVLDQSCANPTCSTVFKVIVHRYDVPI